MSRRFKYASIFGLALMPLFFCHENNIAYLSKSARSDELQLSCRCVNVLSYDIKIFVLVCYTAKADTNSKMKLELAFCSTWHFLC